MNWLYFENIVKTQTQLERRSFVKVIAKKVYNFSYISIFVLILKDLYQGGCNNDFNVFFFLSLPIAVRGRCLNCYKLIFILDVIKQTWRSTFVLVVSGFWILTRLPTRRRYPETTSVDKVTPSTTRWLKMPNLSKAYVILL